MRILVAGASKGLGRALVEGLGGAGDTIAVPVLRDERF
jgi:NAD(P)-dependent dehydrogenase (short-subunit alcohol dehydrogenase family)